jgi:hypothetical protein
VFGRLLLAEDRLIEPGSCDWSVYGRLTLDAARLRVDTADGCRPGFDAIMAFCRREAYALSRRRPDDRLERGLAIHFAVQDVCALAGVAPGKSYDLIVDTYCPCSRSSSTRTGSGCSRPYARA